MGGSGIVGDYYKATNAVITVKMPDGSVLANAAVTLNGASYTTNASGQITLTGNLGDVASYEVKYSTTHAGTVSIKFDGGSYECALKALIARVTITQSANQTIKVVCNGTTYTSSFDAPIGASFTVTVTPATGYNAGTPNVSSGTVTGAISISAGAATKKGLLLLSHRPQTKLSK